MPSRGAVIATDTPFPLRFITISGPSIGDDKDAKKQIRSQAAKSGKAKPIRTAGARNRDAENIGKIEENSPRGFLPRNDPQRSYLRPRTRNKTASGKHTEGLDTKEVAPAVVVSKELGSCAGCPFCLQLWELKGKSPVGLLGGNLDPFLSLPATSNPEVSTARLLFHSRNTERPYIYRSWIGLVDLARPCYEKVAPAFLASRLKSDARVSHMYVDRFSVIMSSLISGTHMDLMRGLPEESLATMAARTDIVTMVNELIADPLSQSNDLIIMAITHLLCCEAVLGNKARVELHSKGLAQVLRQRGNLEAMTDCWSVAQCATVITFFACLIYDFELPAVYSSYPALEASVYSPDSLIYLESPLFSSTSGFSHLLPSKLGSRSTLDMLDDMRQLTLKALMTAGDVSGTQAKDNDASDLSEKALQTLGTLNSLPSAAELGSTVTGDWVYESVRLAALIYTIALLHRIPFSTAVSILEDPRTGMTGRQLTRTLSKACCKTQCPEQWSSMGGVLLWVALVGAAAGQPTSTGKVLDGGGETTDNEGLYEEVSTSSRNIDMIWTAEDDIAYKRLTMIVMGNVGLVVTEHAPALGSALVTMVRIRSFLNAGREYGRTS